MEETVKTVCLFIVVMILKFFESIYDLVTHKYFGLVFSIGIIIYIFYKSLNDIEKLLSKLFWQFKGEYKDDKSIRELLVDIKDKLSGIQHPENYNIFDSNNNVKVREIWDEESILSQEEINELLSKINELQNLPDKWDGRAALPIEKSAVMRAKRFILIMDDYN